MLNVPGIQASDPEARERARQRVLSLNRRIRQVAPRVPVDLTRVAQSEVKVGFLDGHRIDRVIIILRSRGCEWALRSHGGCTMCGHYVGTTRGARVPGDLYLSQFLSEFESIDFRRYPMLCVYNSGSFLNPREVEPATRRAILEAIARNAHIQHVIVESRPEFVTDEVLQELSLILSHKEVEIGVGLETRNDDIREVCLNKGFAIRDFLAVADRMARYQAKLLAYVLIKPPFLTEQEAIDDAIDSATFAFANGTDVVSFEPVSVQDYTLVHYLHEGGAFRPPWIWSVFEVAKATAPLGFIRLGGFEYMPIPRIFTHNCPRCNAQAVAAVEAFNASQDLSSLEEVRCSCREAWQRELQQTAAPLYERINLILDRLAGEGVLARIAQKRDSANLPAPASPRICVPPGVNSQQGQEVARLASARK